MDKREPIATRHHLLCWTRKLPALAGVFLLLGLPGCASQRRSPAAAPEAASDAGTQGVAAPKTSGAPEALLTATPKAGARSAAAQQLAPVDGPVLRDWEECPAIAKIPSSGDILVVGDAHGDVERLQNLLLGAGVITLPPPTREARWNAGGATLVLVGDFTGKWDQSLQVIDLLESLRQQARVLGGQVIVTMGNHEAEFLAPRLKNGKLKWAKKTKQFRKELEYNGLSPKDVWLARGGEQSREVGEFLNCLPAAAASDQWFFSHAGSTQGMTLDELRQAIEAGFHTDGYRADVLLNQKTGLLEARLKPDEEKGIEDVWWQKLPESQEQSEARLRGYAAALGNRRIVAGHQAGKYTFNQSIKRKKAHMFQLFDGTLYLIDVGMSQGQDAGSEFSPGALLRIQRNGASHDVIVICPDETIHSLAPEGESKGVRCEF